ncbi:host cell factor 1 isoform X3 [Frankliniella occidentalis]|uniref:Host cell factor 1 isoform X3 n=1 Tax=Frankliniella occidentalis TaxID=133901 RepID=A0A9C6WSY7_FRAOC|nr:host cell factor 1 isoform X3 [Frankliniella occidentalis]
MEDVEKESMSLLLDNAMEESDLPSDEAANTAESSHAGVDSVGDTTPAEQGDEGTEPLMENEQEGALLEGQDSSLPEEIMANEDAFIVESLDGPTEPHQEMEMMDVAFEDQKDDNVLTEDAAATTLEQANEPMEIPDGTVSTSEGFSEDQFMSGTDALIVQNEPPQQLMEEADTPGEAPSGDITTDIGELEGHPTSDKDEEFFTYVEKTNSTLQVQGDDKSLTQEEQNLKDDALESLVALQDSKFIEQEHATEQVENEANAEDHLELPIEHSDELQANRQSENLSDVLPAGGLAENAVDSTDTMDLPNEEAEPIESELPDEGGVPTESETVAGGEMPIEGELPTEGEMPVEGQLPAEGEMPVSDEMSAESNMPVQAGAPIDGLPPADSNESAEGTDGFTLLAGGDNMEESLGGLEGKLVVGADGTVHLLSQESLQGIQLMEGDETSEEQANEEQTAAQLQQVIQAQLQEALMKQEEIKREEEENRPEPDPSPGDQASAESDALATLASAALDHQAPSNGVKNEPDAPEIKSEPDSNEPQWMDVGICKGTNCVVRSFYIPSEGQTWDKNWENINTSTLPDHRALAKLELEAGKAYKFRVAAINSCGRGPWSEITAFRTSMPGVPGAPSAIKISKTVEGAHLSWDPPAATSGTIEDYTVYMAVRSATTDSQVVSSGATQLAFVRIYQGAENQCSVGFETLTEAHIDTTTKPAILFRIAARNEKGLGPAIQVRWLQDGAAPNSAKPVNAPLRRVGGEIKPHTSIKRKKSECE